MGWGVGGGYLLGGVLLGFLRVLHAGLLRDGGGRRRRHLHGRGVAALPPPGVRGGLGGGPGPAA